MITNISILFVILGVIFVFIAWYCMSNKQKDAHGIQDELRELRKLQESTQRLKTDMEKSAEVIIKRVATSVARLEGLIKEAQAQEKRYSEKFVEGNLFIVECQQFMDEIGDYLLEIERLAHKVSVLNPEKQVPSRSFEDILGNHLEEG